MICPICGTQCDDKDIFCNGCGNRINPSGYNPIMPPQIPLSQPAAEPPGKKKIILPVILILIVLLLLGAAAFVVLDGFDIISEPDLLCFTDSDSDEDDEKDSKDDKEEDDKEDDGERDTTARDEVEVTANPDDKEDESDISDIKIGFIYLHDENSTYDFNIMNAAKQVCNSMGVEYAQKTNVPETSRCYDAAVELIEMDGCNVIFADSFGHESFLLQAAKEYPDVEFCHATGTLAHTSGLSNFHNAYAQVHEGRYLTGVVAGMKLNEMIENGEITPEEAKMGYVGAFTFSEVISAYTAFYLGAKSVCPTVTMEVTFTGSWYDEQLEKEAAQKLINNGCVIISQHVDSLGAPTACEAAGVYNITYNGSTEASCPNTYLATTRILWNGYFTYIINQLASGKEIAVDWCGSFNEDSLAVNFNKDIVSDDIIVRCEELAMDIESGKVKVFDTGTFTVKGEKLTSCLADVDTDANFEPDTEVISDGEFLESHYRSAPYFNLRIDGITLLDENY